MDIFISYAKKDAYGIAICLQKALSKLPDLKVWMDKELVPGKEWDTQIENVLPQSRYMLVLISPDVNRPVTAYQNLSGVRREIHYAQGLKGKKPEIIPLIVQEADIPMILAGVEYIDFYKRQLLGWRRLVTRLGYPKAPGMSALLDSSCLDTLRYMVDLRLGLFLWLKRLSQEELNFMKTSSDISDTFVSSVIRPSEMLQCVLGAAEIKKLSYYLMEHHLDKLPPNFPETME
jgi:hypothetical protein